MESVSVTDAVLDVLLLAFRINVDLFSLALAVIRVPLAAISSLYRLALGPRRPSRTFRSVLVTGASVGIGAGLAVEFAGPGVNMWITATKAENCDATREACERKGAKVFVMGVDVRNGEAMLQLLEEANKVRPLDLVIANAGCTPHDDGVREAAKVIETNAVGTANTIMPAAEMMLRSKERLSGFDGQLVLISSLAGFACGGSLFMSGYVASKNAIRAIGETLRATLGHRIGITTIYPGMTESRMVSTQLTQGVKMTTGVWPLDKAVRIMADGIRRNKADVAYPFVWYAISRIHGSAPSWAKDLYAPILRTVGDPYVILDSAIWKRIKESESEQ